MAIGRIIAGLCFFIVCYVSAAHKECKTIFCLNTFARLILDAKPIDATKSPAEDLIRQSGYQVERHTFKTEDDYILTYHRIPYGKGDTDKTAKRQPVLVQHGLLGASSMWVLSEQALGFSLADAGFDVWLANSRGNTYSRSHTKYDPDKDKKKYWDFSWHEMGSYDLPAGIDYILKTTGYKQLIFIGYSMGTTMFFVLGSERPEYMDKVKAAVVMAPIVHPWNLISPFARSVRSIHSIIRFFMKTFNMHEVFARSTASLWIDHHICSNIKYQYICRNILFSIAGYDEKELKTASLTKVLENTPSGTSMKTLRHLRQISEKGAEFQQFDYGSVQNMWYYHSFKPPEYNLTNVNAPLYVYYASNDWLAVPKDVLYDVKRFPNVKRVKKVPYDEFNHLDYMWGSNAKAQLYDDIISTLKGIPASNTDEPQT